MKQLLVLRHAKSDWADSALADWQRPLSERGVRDAPRAGDWLRTHAIIPDVIITSDAVRARSTAQAVAESAGFTHDLVLEPALYLASPDAIIGVLSELSDDAAGTVLIVGHNPGLEDLIERLTGDQFPMPTAALAHLELPIDRWSDLDASVSAAVKNYWRPKG